MVLVAARLIDAPFRWARRVAPLTVAVLIVGLAVAALVATLASRARARQVDGLIDAYASDLSWAVTAEFDKYLDTVSDVSRAVGAQSDLTADDFASITSGVDRARLPGATRLQFVAPADDQFVILFDRAVTGVAIPTGSRLDPRGGAANAMDESMVTGRVTASAVRTGPGRDRHPVLEVVSPVRGARGTPDTERFRGWILISLDGWEMMTPTLRARGGTKVASRLVDAPLRGRTTLIASSSDAFTELRERSEHAGVRTVTVAGRRWRLETVPTDRLLSDQSARTPWILFGLGLIMTALTAALVGALAGARSRSLDLVARATAELRVDIERRKAVEARLKRSEDRLRFLAFHDPLTGLANRTLFHRRIRQAIRARPSGEGADPGLRPVLVYFDVDDFKKINDDFGHMAGDAVLVELAVRLRRGVRAEDLVARLGGDEFVVFMDGIGERADHVVSRLLDVMSRPIGIDGHRVMVTLSAGVVARDVSDASVDDLLRKADRAMYAAKAAGKGRYVHDIDL